MHRYVAYFALNAFLYQGFVTAALKGISLSLFLAPQTLAFAFFVPALFLLASAYGRLRSGDLIIILVALAFILIKYFLAHLAGSRFDNAQAFWYIGFVILYASLRSSRPLSAAQITGSIYAFGIVSALVALLQFSASALLPYYLIEPPFTKDALLTTIYHYNVGGEERLRPNGLFSNPIVYASFLIIALEIAIMRFIRNKSRLSLLGIGLLAAALLASLSRSAILGLLFLLCAYTFRSSRLFIIIVLAIIGFFLYTQLTDSDPLVLSTISAIADRFTGADSWARASNEAHFSDVELAMHYILSSPIIGYPLGFYIYENVITDGALYILSLEFGIPLTAFIYILLFSQARKQAASPGTQIEFPVYSIYYLLLSSFINSSLIDKALVPILIFLLLVPAERFTSKRDRLALSEPRYS